MNKESSQASIYEFANISRRMSEAQHRSRGTSSDCGSVGSVNRAISFSIQSRQADPNNTEAKQLRRGLLVDLQQHAIRAEGRSLDEIVNQWINKIGRATSTAAASLLASEAIQEQQSRAEQPSTQASVKLDVVPE